MAQFRKVLAVIEAWQWTIYANDPGKTPAWVTDLSVDGKITFAMDHPDGPRIGVRTPHGITICYPGYWIAINEKGSLYVYEPDTFETLYEPIEAEEPTHV